MKKNRVFENVVHGIFLLLGLITVGCVLLITVYLIISGIPAIKEIGLVKFLFGKEWASTAAEPKFGILPFILTSVYGTAGAILIGVPIGLLTAIFLAKFCPKGLYKILKPATELMAGVPSVVYGFFGLVVLVPLVQNIFGVAGNTMLTASVLLGIMIFVGVRANRMYLNHCVHTVQEIKSVSNTETDLSAEYTARGGVNVVVTFCLLACYMILRWIPLFLT